MPIGGPVPVPIDTTGRSAVFAGHFGGRAWDAPTRRKDRNPKRIDFIGEPGGIRTHGPKIKSLVLYQLSYGLAGAL